MKALLKYYWKHHRLWSIGISVAMLLVVYVLSLMLGMEHRVVQFLLTGVLPWMIILFTGICALGEAFEKDLLPYVKSGVHTVKDLKADKKRKKEEKEKRAQRGRPNSFYLEEDYKKKERVGFLFAMFAVTMIAVIILSFCQGNAMKVWESSKGIERLLEAIIQMEILAAGKELLSFMGSILFTLFSFFVLAAIVFLCWGFALTLFNRYQEKKGLYKMETTKEWRDRSCKKE